jgi:DNA-directed RNA polymerase subunit RPC12/RpoP
MDVHTGKCEKCSHEWILRVQNPLKCPKCGHVRGTSVRVKKAAGEGVCAPLRVNPTPTAKQPLETATKEPLNVE